MEDSNFIGTKTNENYNNKKRSPIRTLLKLTTNSKSIKNISIPKRDINPNININYNSKLTKVSSARNINQNYYNINIQNNKILTTHNNNDNYKYNINNSINNNNIISKNAYNNNKYVKTNKDITINYIYNNNNYYYGRKRNDIIGKNMKNNSLKNEENNEYNDRFKKNMIMTEHKNSQGKIAFNKRNYNYGKYNLEMRKDNSDINNNKYFFNSKLEISNKKEEKRKNNFTQKDNNKNNVLNLKNKNDLIYSNTNRNASSMNFFNKYNKSDFKKNLNTLNLNEHNTKNNKYNLKNDDVLVVYSTVNNDENKSNKVNYLIKKNIPEQNQNVIFNIKNENINTVNNILINTQKDIDLNNIVYSPKKGIHHAYSQENVKNKQILEYKSIKENNNIIYKNKSVKDSNNYTYTKKNNLSKNRNNNEYHKRKIISNVINNSSTNNIDSKLDDNQNKKIYNLKTVINKNNANNLKDEKYQIEPDIYPEIKINLRKNKYKRLKNNSAIIKHNKENNNGNDDYNIEYNFLTKLTNIYNKYKKNSNLKKNNNENNNNSNTKKNISVSSYISNINKSVGHNSSISNITSTDTNLNNFLNFGAIPKKNKINSNDKNITINDLYYILIFEEKIKEIFNTILSDKTSYISNYCFELINFFYNFSIDKYIQIIVSDKIDLNKVNIFNNYMLVGIIIFYDLSCNTIIYRSFEIIIKEVLKLIYSNLIIIIKYTNNILKNLEKQENENIFELYDIINIILNRYLNNKNLYIENNEFISDIQNMESSNEDKFYSNLNYIMKNIHTIINNMKKTDNFEHILNIINQINNVSIEDINVFFQSHILKINIFNSSLRVSALLNNYRKRINAPYITNNNTKKYSLVLSLDDTIVHFKTNNIKYNKGVVQVRPGLIELFQNIKSFYEIILFCSGKKKYSDAIIDSIDEKNKFIDHRLYQDHCIIINDDFVKDLSKIGRPLDKMIIVDNISQNYRLQVENGINIKSFYGDNPNDKILYHLSKILITLAQNGGDIRKSIKKYLKEIIYKVCSNIYSNYCK